jgi:hypothetical protein
VEERLLARVAAVVLAVKVECNIGDGGGATLIGSQVALLAAFNGKLKLMVEAETRSRQRRQ